MKLALGIVVLLLGTSVASAQQRNPYMINDWDPFWDFTRHLRNIDWSIQDLNWTLQQQNLPAEQYVPPLPSYKWTLKQLAADSKYSSVKHRQQYKKDRRARTRAKLREGK